MGFLFIFLILLFVAKQNFPAVNSQYQIMGVSDMSGEPLSQNKQRFNLSKNSSSLHLQLEKGAANQHSCQQLGGRMISWTVRGFPSRHQKKEIAFIFFKCYGKHKRCNNIIIKSECVLKCVKKLNKMCQCYY